MGQPIPVLAASEIPTCPDAEVLQPRGRDVTLVLGSAVSPEAEINTVETEPELETRLSPEREPD